MNIWDTSGGERCISLNRIFCKNKDCFVIFYDVTSRYSFNLIDRFINITEASYEEKPVFIVGNKIEDYERREISKEEGENIAKNNNAKYFEISCMTGEGIKEFENRMIIDAIESSQINPLKKEFQSSSNNKSLNEKNKNTECLVF